jgi:F-type H+-transporting ATPase subunit delta
MPLRANTTPTVQTECSRPAGTVRENVADDTKASDAGQRYAKALFDLANETGALRAVEADLKSLAAALNDSVDLRRLLASPVFGAADKAKGLAAIAAKAKFNPTTGKFLGLLAANGRAGDLSAAINAFRVLTAKARGAVSAEVISAAPLTAAQAKGVAAGLRTALGKDPEITTRVDPSLLGGIKVRVGSRLFDASLKSKLDSLKFALKRA